MEWPNNETPPQIPQIPEPKFKIGEVVKNWFLVPHTILGVRLNIQPNSSDSGWKDYIHWEYNLWKWAKHENGFYYWFQWGWSTENEIIENLQRFEEMKNNSFIFHKLQTNLYLK